MPVKSLIPSNVREYLEERIADLVLSAHRLPGYRLHPRETYQQLERLGLVGIGHPKDLFYRDVGDLARAAEILALRGTRILAGTGFLTGLPGGPVGLTAGVALDLEEYIRRTFLLAQQVGQTFGLVPDPMGTAPDDPGEYFEAARERVLEVMLAGLAVAGAGRRGREIAKDIAGEHTRRVLSNKARQAAAAELALKVARGAASRLVGKAFYRVVPVVGGGINAALCYRGMREVGRNLIAYCEAEHLVLRPRVRSRSPALIERGA